MPKPANKGRLTLDLDPVIYRTAVEGREKLRAELGEEASVYCGLVFRPAGLHWIISQMLNRWINDPAWWEWMRESLRTAHHEQMAARQQRGA